MEFITEFFSSGDFWAIVIKVLLTAILTGLLGLVGTAIGKIIAKSKNSRIRKYAETCVKAAEQKFPNEGKKMGPEKMQYVMDQMMIKFPKIRDNQYLYNIAEAAVYELNNQFQKEAAIKEFEEKYGEKPLAVKEKDSEAVAIHNQLELDKHTEEKVTENEEKTASTQVPTQAQIKNKNQNRLKSF